MTGAAQIIIRIGKNADGPDPVDTHVGGRLRLRRNLVGMSQEQLGEALGLTFQQIQKYERGMNRMGASRLYHMSRVLGVPPEYFFDEMPSEISGIPQPGFADNGQAPLDGASGGSVQSDATILQKRETLELIRAYYRIQDPKQRRKVYELIKSMADKAE